MRHDAKMAISNFERMCHGKGCLEPRMRTGAGLNQSVLHNCLCIEASSFLSAHIGIVSFGLKPQRFQSLEKNICCLCFIVEAMSTDIPGRPLRACEPHPLAQEKDIQAISGT